MPERTSYAPGTPNWVELATPDLDAAAGFYGKIFGWEIPELPNSAQLGGYRRVRSGGADVAGAAPLMAEGQPPVWSTYISVEDAEATAALVADNGGSAIVPPMDVMGMGKMAVFTDPTGAVFGIWQPGTFAGADRVNEPGCFTWNELGTRDTEGAKAFYGAVFGWGADDHDMGEMGTYTEWQLGDESIAGMLDITGVVPDEVPSYWLTYFAVEDTDAALETIKAEGGSVSFGPVEIPAGRFAVANDPWGAMFAVIKLPADG